MNKYPEPSIGAFIRNQKGEILLVKSFKWDKQKIWHVPGGRVEIGETIKQACLREVKEEVGIRVDFLRHFATWDAIFPKQFYKKKHFIFFECECMIKKREKVQIDNCEIQTASWFSFPDALQQPLETFTQKSLKLLI